MTVVRMWSLNEAVLKSSLTREACLEAPIESGCPWEVLHYAALEVTSDIRTILETLPDQPDYPMIGDEVIRSAHRLIDLADAMSRAPRDPRVSERLKAWDEARPKGHHGIAP
jgi:hypothetical protein